MKRIPAIKSVMTPFPYSMDVDDTLQDALAFMKEKDFHHLPVTRDKALIGVISNADIDAYLNNAASGPPQNARVGDLAMGDTCLVDLNERLDLVLDRMSGRRVEVVIVTRHGKLAGVFTITDVCARFAEYLRDQFRPPDGGEAA